MLPVDLPLSSGLSGRVLSILRGVLLKVLSVQLPVKLSVEW